MSYPRYSQYKESRVEWAENIPSHWQVLPLFAVMQERDEPNTGNREKNVLSLSYGRIIRRDVESNFGLLPESFETYQIVEPRNIVMRLTDLQNDQRSLRVGLVRERGIITSAYVGLEPLPQTDHEFAYYLLHSYDLYKVYYGLGGGVRQSMKFQDLKHLPILLPPLPEQRTIAAFLDRETARIDTLIAKQEQMIALLYEKRKALISHAVTRSLNPQVRTKNSGVEWLGDVPEHWKIKRLAKVAYLHRGYDLTADARKEGSVPVVTSGGLVDFHDVAKAPGPGVVMGRYGTTGELFYVEQDYWPHNTALYVHDFHGNIPRYVFYLLQILPFEAHSGKSAVPGIDRNDLHVLLVCEPPLDEQAAIAAYIDREIAKIQTLIDKAQTAIDLLKEHRTSLISAAVTGKIDVRGEVAMGQPLIAQSHP